MNWVNLALWDENPNEGDIGLSAAVVGAIRAAGAAHPDVLYDPDEMIIRINAAIRNGVIRINQQGVSEFLAASTISQANTILTMGGRLTMLQINRSMNALGQAVRSGNQSAIDLLQRNNRRYYKIDTKKE